MNEFGNIGLVSAKKGFNENSTRVPFHPVVIKEGP
jgi:hypothetical protein